MRGAGLTAALGAIAFWSALAALALRLKHLPPFLTLGVGFLLGALVGAKGLLRERPKPAVLLLGTAGLFGYHFCLFTALRLAPPLEANLLNYLWPLLIVALSPLLLSGARLEGRHLAGAALGFAGAALLVARGGGPAPARLAGDALAVAAAFVWAVYSLLTKRFGGFPTATVSWFCLLSGLLALACHAALEPRAAVAAADWPALALVGLGPMGASFYLWDRAMKDGDPRAIGTLSYLTPLLSTLWIAALGEGRLTPATGAAGLLIVGGAAAGTLRPRRAR
ncbi:MAG: DMT family transporter [Elusimicrobia bacterium]|nr:DMT family transporter [Elusimicrobiota bacterium]